MKRFALIWATTVLGWILTDPAQGQDTQYWNEQYGARSMLLSGSVIGSVDDMSAVFYNPGALGYLEKPELVLSASAYQLRQLKVKDGAGRGVDLGSSQINLIPNLIAGSFKFNFHGPNKLAYSVLTRYRFGAEFQTSRMGQADLDPDTPGDEFYSGGLISSIRVSDVWVGLTWAKGLGEKLGLGITTFFSARSQEGQDDFFLQTMNQTGELALLYDLENFDAHMYGLLWKAGLGLNLEPFTAGLTVTTPKVRMGGSGSYVVNSTWAVSGGEDEGFVTDIQTDVKARHETPWSVGLGAAWQIGDSKIHFSTEWFNSVANYDVLELQPYYSQESGEQISPTFKDQSESVLNFAVGFEHEFSEKYSGFLGFNTDNSAYSPESDLATTSYDLVHLAGGAKMDLKKVRFKLGARYAWGDQAVDNSLVDIPTTGTASLEPLNEGTVTFRQLTLILGFALDI